MLWLFWIVSNVLLAFVLAVAAWILQRWLRRPAIAHILWVLVLVKLVTPPLVSVPLNEALVPTTCATGACEYGQHAPTQTLESDTWSLVLLGVWSTGAGLTGWTAWRRWTRFKRLIGYASPAPPEWQALATRLSSELSLRRPPEILAVPGPLPPLVVPGR